MKIIAISDTHGQHRKLQLPKGDILIHAGDLSKRGGKLEIMDFLDWYSKLDFQYKIFIAGNHDFYFQDADPKEIKELIPSNLIYLNDTGIEIEGIKIWGSPIQPWFYDWAFNRQRGADIKKHWDLIPEETDILITHGPALRILDMTAKQEAVGCEDLFNRIMEIKPKIHIFGHIHEAQGELKFMGTHFINASVVNLNYHLVNDAIEVEF